MRREIILLCLLLLLPLISLVVLANYSQARIKLQENTPINTFCQTSGTPPDPICTNEARFKRFLFIYLDGVPLAFVKAFLEISRHRSHSILVPIKHTGVYDSRPAFHTFFTGNIPFNYDDNFRSGDSFFAQIQKAGLLLRTVIDKTVDMLPPSFKEKNENEFRGLSYSITSSLTDWYKIYRKNSKRQKKQKLMRSFAVSLRFFKLELGRRLLFPLDQPELLSNGLKNNLLKFENQFIYIPEFDNFTHDMSLRNKNYLRSLAIEFANIKYIFDHVSKNAKEVLIVLLSDHGADESPFQQERGNHETPGNSFGNRAFLSLFNPSLLRGNFNESQEIEASGVAGILATMIKGLNIPSLADFVPGFFKSGKLKEVYLQSFVKKLKNSGITIEATTREKLVGQISEANLRNKRELIDKETTNLNFFAKFYGIIMIGIAIYLLFLPLMTPEPKSKRDVLRVVTQNFFIVSLFLISAILGEINENTMLIIIGLNLASLAILDFVFSDQESINALLALLGLFVWAFHPFAISHERFFFNHKNALSLIVTNSLLGCNVCYLLLRPFLSKKNVGNWARIINVCIKWLFSLLFLLSVFHDVISTGLVHNENTPVLAFISSCFNIGIIVLIILTVLMPASNIRTNMTLITLLLITNWTSSIVDRIIFCAVFSPFFFIFLQGYFKLNQTEDPRRRCFEVSLALFGIFCFLARRNQFDWRNIVRLLYKFDLSGLYKAFYALWGVGLALGMGSGVKGTSLGLAGLGFGFVGVAVMGLKWEIRMSQAKLLEMVIVVWYIGIAIVLREMFWRKNLLRLNRYSKVTVEIN